MPIKKVESEPESVIEAARRVLAEEIEREETAPLEPTPPADPDTGEVIEVPPETVERMFGIPREEVFVNVSGGKYLPARRRVTWLRGEPEQHPNWTIDTHEITVQQGEVEVTSTRSIRGIEVSNIRIKGGYARIEANVYDETGRLIATGRKTEHSERFLDFVEKAETGAIARALAIAGYGTEAALDLDEGVDQERIADAPVTASGRPINITASSIPGLSVGGRTQHITDAQLSEIARITRDGGLGVVLPSIIEGVTGKPVEGIDGLSGIEFQKAMVAYLRTLSFEEGGEIIKALGNVPTATTKS